MTNGETVLLVFRLEAKFMGRFLLLPCFLLTVGTLVAHEIKVLASKQSVTEVGGKTTIYLSWGHLLPIDDLVDSATLDRYELLDPMGKASPLKAADKSLQTNVVELPQEGVYQAVVGRKASVITYVLDEEGQRQMKRGPKSAQTGSTIDSAMRSMQAAKAMIVVGLPGDKAPTAVGLPLEIVPMQGPSKWITSETLTFKVLREGKPLASADVVARPVGFKPDNAWCYATTSNRKGEFQLKATQAGTWVIKVRSKTPAPEKQRTEYDYDSYTSTLSLEVNP
jgi:uncharacterized GH25 family protein